MFKDDPKKLNRAWLCVSLIDKYEEIQSAGGSLHIVLEDGNSDDRSLRYCLEYASEKNDVFGEEVAKQLLFFTEKEREYIYTEYDQIKKDMEFAVYGRNYML